MIKNVRGLKVKRPPLRHQLIALRLSGDDRKKLEGLAKQQGIGVSTFARMIIETYIRTHAPGAK